MKRPTPREVPTSRPWPTKQDSRIQADTFPLPSQRTDMGRSRPLGHYHERRVGSAASVQRHRALGPQAATHVAWSQDDKAPTPGGHQTQTIGLGTHPFPEQQDSGHTDGTLMATSLGAPL